MDKLYQEGGLADDGTDIEPVTGNEVPTGSLDQEVRDDIPAQLSEGEYVVPADVVRYYGVKFFEDLRGQAKQDFARMESEGRVGGEPVDSTGIPMEEDEELSPEEMQMLQEALGGTATGMAMGGMVPQQQQMQYNPYEQQQMQYSQPARQPMFQTTRAVGMQEGGDVPSFNPSDYSYGGGFQSPFNGDASTAGQGGMQLVEYINPTSGQTRMITVLNGEPIGMVPEGFIPSSPEARKQAQKQNQKVDTKTEGTREERGPDETKGQDKTTGYSGPLSGNVAENIQEQIESAGKFSGIGGLAGGLIGALVGLPGLAAVGKTIGSNISESASVGDALETAALADIMGYSDLSAKGLSKAEELAKNFDIDITDDLMSKAGSKALAEFNSAVDAAKSAGLSREAFGSDEAFGRAMEATAPTGMSVSKDRQGNITGYSRSPSQAAPTTSARPQARPSNLSTSRGGRESSVSDTVGGAIAGMADKGFGSAPSSSGGTAGGRAGDGSRGGSGGTSGGRGGQTGGTGATAGGAAGDGSRGGGSSSSGDTSGAASGPAGASGTAGAGGPSGDDDAGTPRAKGGLMGNPKGSQRKKPVKNKRKGLASK